MGNLERVKRRNKAFVFAALVVLVIIVRDYFGISINKYILVALYAVAFAALPANQIQYLLAFSFPLCHGIPSNYILGLGVLFLLFKQHSKIDGVAIVLLSLTVSQELSLSLLYGELPILDELSYVLTLCLTLFILSHYSTVDRGEANRLLTYFLVGCAAAFALLIAVYIGKYGISTIFNGSIRLGDSPSTSDDSSMRIRFNANEIGYYSLVAVSIFAVLVREKGLRRVNALSRIAIVVSALVCFVAGFLSLSRTWLFGFAICLLLHIWLTANTLRKKMAAPLIAVMCVGCCFAVIAIAPDLFAGFQARLLNGNLDSFGGRMDVFSLYNDYLANNASALLVGSTAVSYQSVSGIGGSVHNGFQQIIVAYGLIGGLVFLGYLARMIYLSVKGLNVKSQAVSLLPMFAALMFVQSIQIINPIFEIFPLIVSVAAIRTCGLKNGRAIVAGLKEDHRD